MPPFPFFWRFLSLPLLGSPLFFALKGRGEQGKKFRTNAPRGGVGGGGGGGGGPPAARRSGGGGEGGGEEEEEEVREEEGVGVVGA